MIIRRKGSGRLRRSEEYEEDVNPMEGTSNMADAMLVLAVGMMLAVIVSWNVDFSTPASMKELDNAETLSEEEVEEVQSNDSLQEKGTVYQDPDTGKFYVKVQDEEE